MRNNILNYGFFLIFKIFYLLNIGKDRRRDKRMMPTTDYKYNKCVEDSSPRESEDDDDAP